MKLNQLRGFIAIAEARSIRSASRTLGIGQPALTRSLRQLEACVNVSLVERHGNGVSLTPYGSTFLAYCRSAIQGLEKGRQEIAQLQGKEEGKVTVGLSGDTLLPLLAHVFEWNGHNRPSIQLKLDEGVFSTLEPRIRNGDIDFYVGPVAEQELGNSYAAQWIAHTKYGILARRRHPLSHAQSLADLLDARWVTIGDSVECENAFERLFTRNGLPPPRDLTRSATTLSALTLIAAADAVAILPTHWASEPPFSSSLQSLDVGELPMRSETAVVSRRGIPLTPAAQRIATLFERAGCNAYWRASPQVPHQSSSSSAATRRRYELEDA